MFFSPVSWPVAQSLAEPWLPAAIAAVFPDEV
jgi:hypothetical protein